MTKVGIDCLKKTTEYYALALRMSLALAGVAQLDGVPSCTLKDCWFSS